MQRGFVEALLDPERPAPDGVIRPDGAPATKRFNVYRNNVVVSLVEALKVAFPAVTALVGEEFFEAVAREFVPRHQPKTPLLMLYGAEFPGFLAGFPPAQGLPYLADVARLEQARREAYHAADVAPADPGVLADLSPEALMAVRFSFAPATRLVASAHPILSIWTHAMGPDAPAITAAQEDVLVTRPKLDVAMAALPAGGAAFVAEMMGGAALGAAAEPAAQVEGFDLAAILTCLFETGALAGITRT